MLLAQIMKFLPAFFMMKMWVEASGFAWLPWDTIIILGNV